MVAEWGPLNFTVSNSVTSSASSPEERTSFETWGIVQPQLDCTLAIRISSLKLFLILKRCSDFAPRARGPKSYSKWSNILSAHSCAIAGPALTIAARIPKNKNPCMDRQHNFIDTRCSTSWIPIYFLESTCSLMSLVRHQHILKFRRRIRKGKRR